MQPCFFHLSGVLPPSEVVPRVKQAIETAYAKRGSAVVERNFAAVDRALESLYKVQVPSAPSGDLHRMPPPPSHAPDFVRRVTARLLEGEGDLLPVSALPVDGTFPTGTARWLKRRIAQDMPVWDPSLCIDCGKCAVVCPHSAIRMKIYAAGRARGRPPGFLSKAYRSHDIADHLLTVQVLPDDCTGCGLCVEICPAHSKSEVKHKSLDMAPVGARRDDRASPMGVLRIYPRDATRHGPP